MWFICLTDFNEVESLQLPVLQTDVIPDIKQKHDPYKPFVLILMTKQIIRYLTHLLSLYHLCLYNIPVTSQEPQSYLAGLSIQLSEQLLSHSTDNLNRYFAAPPSGSETQLQVSD